MSALDQFESMADLQDQINSKISDSWRDNGNAWYRAIWIEAAEMMDHIHYKWWKSGEIDIEQVHLELVDIFHFALSDLLEKNGSVQNVAAMLDQQWLAFTPNTVKPLIAVEELARQTLNNKAFAPNAFYQAMHSVDLDLDSLFKLYVCKNVLNSFRQDKGYKDPSVTYHKIINGKEDNEHLMELAATIDAGHPDFKQLIYAGLENIYSK